MSWAGILPLIPWHCPRAENELLEGKQFNYEMAARDGSMTFDFIGTFDRIIPENGSTFRSNRTWL